MIFSDFENMNAQEDAGDLLHIENPSGMNVYLFIRSGRLLSTFISYTAKGLSYFMDNGVRNPYVHVEIVDGECFVVCHSPAHFISNDGNSINQFKLYHHSTVRIEVGNEIYLVYAEEVNDQSGAFHNYILHSSEPITIGREDDNDIYIYDKQRMISRHHARLFLNNSSYWNIVDNNSANGIYVKGRQIPQNQEIRVNFGDMINILGLKIIAGPGFLSINDSNYKIHISSKLRYLNPANITPHKKAADDGIKLYNRLPRERRYFPEKTIGIESPPPSMANNQIPLFLRIGSPLAMGAMSAMYGNVLMSLTTLAFPLLSQRYTDKQIQEYEKRRLEKYNIYLVQKRQEIAKEIDDEGKIYTENYPSLDTVLRYAVDGKKLWERRKTDDDFLNVRVGTGIVPLKAEISYSDRSFQLDTDELQEKMYQIAEKKYTLNNFPVFVDLLNNPVCGVVTESGIDASYGKRLRIEFVKRMLLRIVSLYSYDEVKIVFISDRDTLKYFDFVKFLPHIWDNQKSTRFLATNESEAYQVGEYLKKQFEDDLDSNKANTEKRKARPHYILFGLDGHLVNCIEIIKQIMQADKKIGFTSVCAYDDLPKECSLLMTLGKQGAYIKYLKDLDKENQVFMPDNFDENLANKSMQIIGNTMLGVGSKAYILPKAYKFLSMFHAGKVEDLNIFNRWKESDPVSTLAAPVGLDENGDLFMLDLHQKYEGPHGLVAGMTGSGKSEFLITYILSMAICYSPEEVAFVLIDYKGGGLTGAFEDKDRGIHLPHLLGTITNLDGSAINRALVSFHSELLRRQRIFNEAKSIAEEGTMDIYMYQRLYRSGKVKALGPVPHLFIISDEFAELKSQQPDFLDELVSIARIGRSLGVHLILATQKPAGVVSDQIWSNSKFRVCLKVQDRSDSDDMIKRPDAAELKETGRFYLQVGYDEYFAMGQSAWSGADYIPTDSDEDQSADEEIELIDNSGEVVQTVRPDKATNAQGTQLTAVVNYLSESARQIESIPQPLWSAPLPSTIDLKDLLSENLHDGSIIADIGMVDDPKNQKQYPYTLDLLKDGNVLIIGNPGSGKSIFLQTLLHSLSAKYNSEEINFYIFDYSSRMLRIFKDLPQCGAVLTDEEYQYVPPVIQTIGGAIAERKSEFEKLGVADYESALQIKKFPMIILIVDNVIGLRADDRASDYYDNMDQLMKIGFNYGIRFIFTATHLDDVNRRIKQECAKMIALRLNTTYEYGDVLDIRVRFMPTECSGRALIRVEDDPNEMQVGIFASESENESVRTNAVKEFINTICENSTTVPAIKISIASSDETYEDFVKNYKSGRIPLGYRAKNGEPVALPLAQLKFLNFYFGNQSVVKPVLTNLFYSFMFNGAEVKIIKKNEKSSFSNGNPYDIENELSTEYFECDIDGVQNLFSNLRDEIQKRQDLRRKYCNENGRDMDGLSTLLGTDQEQYIKELKSFDSDLIRQSMSPIFILVEDLADFCAVTNECKEILEKHDEVIMYNKKIAEKEANSGGVESDTNEEENLPIEITEEMEEEYKKSGELLNFLDGLLSIMSAFQIYFIGLTDENDYTKLNGSVIETIKKSATSILLGQNYSSQNITNDFYGARISENDGINTAFIIYRRMCYKLRFLFENTQEEEKDIDFEPVFNESD